METNYNYNEPFTSRVDDIRRDGPSIYTSVLELIDNSLGWGNASDIYVNFDSDRMELNIKDNGKNGFGTIESLHRFFSLGKTNENITEITIGKYGKGGYKATINIGDSVLIRTYFDKKEYTIGTDYITMMRENTQFPTLELQEFNNFEDNIGTHFKIKIRPEYKLIYHTDTLKRNVMRAYHKSNIDININDEIVERTCLFGDDYLHHEIFDIVYDRDKKCFLGFKFQEDISYGDNDDNDDNDVKH